MIDSDSLTMTIWDQFPVSPGHTLIVTRRHVESYFDTTAEERLALDQALFKAQEDLKVNLRPVGFNIGINAGIDAGQTVMHVHVHLIPRYSGDVANTRGGIRHVIPGKGDYTQKP
jgi:diadenosine tetraphosphate (Ap4A) HIT family hydrolase